MATENIKVISGNRTEIQLDGKTVGLLQNVNCQDDYSPEPASGIGDIHVTEYVPTLARHVITCSSMVLIQANMRSLGITAENGDMVLRGLVFDIVLYGKGNSAGIIRKYTGCSYASGSVSVAKNQIMVTDCTFNALDVSGTGA